MPSSVSTRNRRNSLPKRKLGCARSVAYEKTVGRCWWSCGGRMFIFNQRNPFVERKRRSGPSAQNLAKRRGFHPDYLALGRLIGKLLQVAKCLSPAAQILILTTIAAVVAHPKSRAKLMALWDSLNKSLRPAMFEAIVECMYQLAEATSTAQETYQSVDRLLPPNRRRPLLSHARSVCLVAKKPLALEELVQRIIASGYSPRSERPHSYLLRKLRSNSEFFETETGNWIIRPVTAAV